MKVKQKFSSVMGILRRHRFQLLMVGFTFILLELAWAIILGGEVFILKDVPHDANDWCVLFFPAALLLLFIPFSSDRTSRTSRGIVLFFFVCVVAIAVEWYLHFVPVLQFVLSILIGVACGDFIYMDNFQFLRSRIDNISHAADSENRRLVIQLAMEEAKAYFDNTMKGIYAVGTAAVVVISIVWAIQPANLVINNVERGLLSLTSAIIVFLLLGAALVWLAMPASECMTRLAEILLESSTSGQ